MRKLVLIATFAAAVSGCKEPCAVPAGKYEIEYRELEGDCPPNIVDTFAGKKAEMDIEPGECRRFSHRHAVPLESKRPNTDCELGTEMSGELTATGVEAAQAVVTLHCTKPEVATCRHLFWVEYRRKP